MLLGAAILRRDFHYALPAELIAQQAPEPRGASRLLVLDRDTGAVQDKMFADLPSFLRPGDLLVFNDTKVIPARLYGRKTSGGKVEILIERLLDSQRALAHIRASRSPKPGQSVYLAEADDIAVEVLGRQGELFELRFEQPLLSVLQRYGHVPLPSYIERSDNEHDSARYQTVYARVPGAVAAPTAGLHFDQKMLDGLSSLGVERSFITLHVGAGTFQPVRAERIEDHPMHAEVLAINAASCAQIQTARQRGGRVIAVGTTVVRALESAYQAGEVRPFQGETDIFIYPGFQFRAIDAMMTNFHLPESTLLMLVAAFAGFEHTLHAYHHAVAQRYRFFSYGDTMLIHSSVELGGLTQ